MSSVPPIYFEQMENWADDNVNIPKRIQKKGYSNWIEGYIHDIQGKLGCNVTVYKDLLSVQCSADRCHINLLVIFACYS